MASYQYASKQELKQAIHEAYLKLDAEFDEVSEEELHLRLPDVDRTPSEIIAYQLGWLELVMGWDRSECAGQPPEMPAPGHKWNQLGELYQSFYDRYKANTLAELREQFRELEGQFLAWIETLSEEELFTQGVRRWTGDLPAWPMVRWIHINSAAPFKSFRSKIRKWKKTRG